MTQTMRFRTYLSDGAVGLLLPEKVKEIRWDRYVDAFYGWIEFTVDGDSVFPFHDVVLLNYEWGNLSRLVDLLSSDSEQWRQNVDVGNGRLWVTKLGRLADLENIPRHDEFPVKKFRVELKKFLLAIVDGGLHFFHCLKEIKMDSPRPGYAEREFKRFETLLERVLALPD